MIDLYTVGDLWDRKCVQIVQELHGSDVNDSEEIRGDKAAARTEKAEASRKLLELADLLSLMEATVRNEYWIFKGKGVDLEIGYYDD
jgi:hypothetical protein